LAPPFSSPKELAKGSTLLDYALCAQDCLSPKVFVLIGFRQSLLRLHVIGGGYRHRYRDGDAVTFHGLQQTLLALVQKEDHAAHHRFVDIDLSGDLHILVSLVTQGTDLADHLDHTRRAPRAVLHEAAEQPVVA